MPVFKCWTGADDNGDRDDNKDKPCDMVRRKTDCFRVYTVNQSITVLTRLRLEKNSSSFLRIVTPLFLSIQKSHYLEILIVIVID